MGYNLDDKELVSVFDELPLWAAPFGLKLLDAIRLQKNITALDIGFGTGFPLLEIAQRLGNTCTVYGIDPWKTAIERVKKKIEIYRISNVKLIEGVAEKIPLPDTFAELIVSNNGLNNVSDLELSIGECARIAKKNAQLVLAFNLPDTMKEFYGVFEAVLRENKLNGAVKKMQEHIHAKRKPALEWKRLLEKNGFRVSRLQEHSFDYAFTDGSSMLNYYFIRLAFRDSWEALVPGAASARVFSMVEERLNKQAAGNAGIKLSVPFVIMDCIRK